MTQRGPSYEELRLYLSLRAQQFTDVLDNDEVNHSFEVARDLEDAESYGYTILERVKAVGPIVAACEDVADAIGELDYDEAILATWATVGQWEAVANSIQSTDKLAFRVRLAARQLHQDLERGGFDPEMLADLVSLAGLESELTNAALSWLQAVEDEAEDEFWQRHGVRLDQAFALSSGLKADLRRRGELDLLDGLLLDDEGNGDPGDANED